MNALIIFDVNKDHLIVKNAMRAQGYYDAWISNNIQYDLPNNTLWKPNTTLQQAYNDLFMIVNNLNRQNPLLVVAGQAIIIQKCIVVPNNPWVGLPVNR